MSLEVLPNPAAQFGLLRVDHHQHVIYCNERWKEITGRKEISWSREIALEMVHPDDRDRLGELIEELLRNGSCQLDFRLLRPDGTTRHVLAHAVLEYARTDGRLEFRSAQVVLVDVSAQVLTQQALFRLNAEQRAIINGVAHPILTADLQGLITNFNQAAEQMLGYRFSEVRGLYAPSILVVPEQEQALSDLHAYLLATHSTPNADAMASAPESDAGVERAWIFRHKNGTPIEGTLAVRLLYDEQQQLTGFVGIATDLREHNRRKSIEEKQDQLIKHMLRGLGAKIGVDFFATLANELSNALGKCAVQGVELLPGTNPPKGRTLINMHAVKSDEIVPLAGTPALFIMQSGRPQHWRDIQSAYPDIESLRFYNVRDYMGVPLTASDGSVLGALILYGVDRAADQLFAMQLLQTFSVRAASELERLRHERDILNRNADQRWILDHSGLLHDQNDVRTVGEITAKALTAHHSHPWATIGFCHGEGYHLLSHTGGPIGSGHFKKVYPRLRLHQRAAEAANGLVTSTDIETDLADTPQTLQLMRLRNTHALIFIALFDGTQEVGSIVLEFSDARAIDGIDIDSLLIYTHAVGLALGRAIRQEQLEYQATHDSLTGLLNRSVLHKNFAERQKTVSRGALLLLDLNRFKEVNDTLGHMIGDALLQQVANRMQVITERHGCTLYRLGGDEFAVCAYAFNEEQALSLGNELRNDLQNSFALDDVNLEIGGSIGVALYPQHGNDSHALLRSADVAMYKAKQGELGVTLYHPDLDMNSTERLELIAEFRQGLNNRELISHFQPKRDLHTNSIVGFEALVRWNHPRLGLLLPERFLPLIEMTDTIHDLTHTALEQACAQLQQWRSADIALSLSVNLSARNLIDDRLFQCLQRLLTQFPQARGGLELDITETALIHDPDRLMHLMQKITALDVTFSIDDFGTGYSSLACLRRMPITSLKIDRSFIHAMETGGQDNAIVETTIALAHKLGLIVIAEGVESDAVLQILRAMGCDQIQGNHVSQPMSAEATIGWLRRYSQR